MAASATLEQAQQVLHLCGQKRVSGARLQALFPYLSDLLGVRRLPSREVFRRFLGYPDTPSMVVAKAVPVTTYHGRPIPCSAVMNATDYRVMIREGHRFTFGPRTGEIEYVVTEQGNPWNDPSIQAVVRTVNEHDLRPVNPDDTVTRRSDGPVK